MKRILAWVLLMVMVLGMFAGCKPKEEPTPSTEPSTTAPQNQGVQGPGAQDAMDYLKSLYQEDGTETAVDFNRYGIIRVGGIEFNIVWTVDVAEDLVKVVANEDGTVTIDINEQCEEATPYKLTATITDANGNSASHTWNHILPKAQDMVEIVKAAYALGKGESLPYQSRLIGKIVTIDTIWTDEYQNITVTIAVEGAEDMPIKCYRMKATDNTLEVIKDLKVGNIITVIGVLKNYEGTIEFDAGCLLEKVEKGDAVDAPTDPGQILKEAYALKQDQVLPYQATLTGVVTQIDAPYDPNYGNISVIIVVEGYEKYPMLCYRLKGTGVDEIAIDDLITVTGIIKNYRGTIEYDAGCMMIDRVSGGGVAQKPSSDAAKILADAVKLKPGESLPYRATLTGEIYSVDNAYDPGYGNVTVTIKVNGVKIQCYRMIGDGIDQIRETDKITVTGVIKNYNGKLEFDTRCNLDSWEKGPRNVNYGPVKEDVAYRLYIDQKATGNTVYFNGKVSSNRLQTTTTGSKGADVYAERISGKGLRFFYMDGETKTYIEIEEFTNDQGKQRGGIRVTTTPSCYWVYNSECGVYIVNLPTAGKYFLGSYGTYETVSASWIGYIDGSYAGGSDQYVAKFIEADKVQDAEPSDTIVQGTAVENPVVGTAYKFGYYQNQVEGKPFLAFSGKLDGFYYGTADAIANMVDVYLEEANGGYHIYFMNGNTKTYLDLVPRDNEPTKVNTVLQTSGEHTVYSLNLEHKYVYTTAVGSEWYLGTFSTNKNISASKTSYISDTSLIGASQFCAWFSEVEEVEAPENPTEPTEPQPSEPANALVEEGVAYKLYMVQSGIGKTLYFNGSISGNRMQTTTVGTQGADVYAELDGSKIRFYYMDGSTKTYIEIEEYTNDKGQQRGQVKFTTTPSCYWTYDEANGVYVVTLPTAGNYFLGTYNTYDTITASWVGYIDGTYSGSTQYIAKFIKASDVSGEPTEPTEPTEPQPTEPAGEAGVVAVPEVETAYKLGIDIGTKVMYFTGKTTANANFRLDVNTDVAKAADVYLEAADGGYRLYFIDGSTKTYIRLYQREAGDPGYGKGSLELVTTAPSEVMTFDEVVKTLIYEYDGNNAYYMGTYDSKGTIYENIAVSNTSFISGDKAANIDVSQFPARFYIVDESGADPDVTEPEATEPEATEPQPSEPTGETGVVEVPEAETAYKLGIDIGTKVMYFTGETTANANFRLAVDTDAAKAADVYLEAADGGYYLYFMDGSTKTYIRMYQREAGDPGYGKGSLELVTTAPSEVMTYDEVVKTLIYEYDGDNAYYMGTYNSKGVIYENIAVSNTSYISGDKAANVDVTQFPARFYIVDESGADPDATEPEATEPEATEPGAAGDGYNKITSAAEFTTGKYVMVVSSGYAPGVYDNTWLSAVQPVISGNTVTDTKGAVWTLTVNGSSVTITDANGVVIKPKGGNNNGVLDGSYDWAWSFENGTFKFAGTGSDTVVLASNATTTGQFPGNNRFRGYKTTTVSSQASNYPNKFTLYKLGGTTGEEPEVTEPQVTEPQVTEPQPTTPSVLGGVVSNPVAGTAYKLGIDIGTKVMYFTGETTANANFRLAVDTDAAKAADVYLEAADGGYYLYFMDGSTKTYIRMYQRQAGNPGYGKGSLELVTTAPAEVMTFDEVAKTLIYAYDGDNAYYMGTYVYQGSVYENIAVSNSSYITGSNASKVDVSQFPVRFYAVEAGGAEPDVTEPEATEPEATEPEATQPSAGASVTYTFSNYGKGVQYEAESYDLDDMVTLDITGCHMNTQLRIYQDKDYDGKAVFTCAKAIRSLVINAGHYDATLKVMGSNDGVNYTEITTVSVTASYGDHTVEMPAGTNYKYLMLDAVNRQIRIPYITFNFAE